MLGDIDPAAPGLRDTIPGQDSAERKREPVQYYVDEAIKIPDSLWHKLGGERVYIKDGLNYIRARRNNPDLHGGSSMSPKDKIEVDGDWDLWTLMDFFQKNPNSVNISVANQFKGVHYMITTMTLDEIEEMVQELGKMGSKKAKKRASVDEDEEEEEEEEEEKEEDEDEDEDEEKPKKKKKRDEDEEEEEEEDEDEEPKKKKKKDDDEDEEEEEEEDEDEDEKPKKKKKKSDDEDEEEEEPEEEEEEEDVEDEEKPRKKKRGRGRPKGSTNKKKKKKRGR